MKWYNSIKTKVIGFFLLIYMVFLVIIIVIFSIIREEALVTMSPVKVDAATSEVLRNIRNAQNKMEEVVLILASVVKEDIKNINIIKAIFSADTKSMIVSGGIWFESYAKKKDKKDHIYFFNKNKDNTFSEVLDYLKKIPQSYRKTEFYLSAKQLKEGETFWTKVYSDPVTKLRMITVVAPIYKNDIFIGVASLDLELANQEHVLFGDTLKFKKSYLMMLDREGELISKSSLLNNILAHDDNIYNAKNPKIAKLLSYVKPALGYSNTPEHFDETLVKNLSNLDISIDHLEEESVATLLKIRQKKSDQALSSRIYFLEDDPILGTKSIVAVYHFPFAHWNVVIGIPENQILAQSNKIAKQIIVTTIFWTLLATIFGYFLLSRVFIKPIEDINEQLNENLLKSENKYKILTCEDKGEIGSLVENLNTRTIALENSLEREALEVDKRVINEKLLMQQSKMAAMGEMMDAVAHQWKQPLNALSMYSDIIKSDFDEGEVDAAYMAQFSDDLQLQIGHMVSTLDEFRNFFRPSEKMQDFLLIDVINSVLILMKDQLLKHRITVAIEKDEKIMLHGSANEFKHLILNLFNNAKDAFKENNIKKRMITIRLMHQEKNDVLEVEDNAGGIPKKVIKDIFKANVTTKELGKGTGIGLYMSTQIAQHYGATLSVYSQKNGSCFVVTFNK